METETEAAGEVDTFRYIHNCTTVGTMSAPVGGAEIT